MGIRPWELGFLHFYLSMSMLALGLVLLFLHPHETIHEITHSKEQNGSRMFMFYFHKLSIIVLFDNSLTSQEFSVDEQQMKVVKAMKLRMGFSLTAFFNFIKHVYRH